MTTQTDTNIQPPRPPFVAASYPNTLATMPVLAMIVERDADGNSETRIEDVTVAYAVSDFQKSAAQKKEASKK